MIAGNYGGALEHKGHRLNQIRLLLYRNWLMLLVAVFIALTIFTVNLQLKFGLSAFDNSSGSSSVRYVSRTLKQLREKIKQDSPGALAG